MADVAVKFGLNNQVGQNFSNPRQFGAYRVTASEMNVFDSGGTGRALNVAAAFTELARRGIQDQTDWTADTYKTILSVTGAGCVAAIIGPTAGGSSTTTFEITVDGFLREVAVTGLSSGERGCLLLGYGQLATFTTVNLWATSGAESLDSNKEIFTDINTGTEFIPAWWWMLMMGTPMLQFNQSLLIRAKHSADITNSTATAYSAVMYRKYLGS
jgi:hypothetical protein